MKQYVMPCLAYASALQSFLEADPGRDPQAEAPPMGTPRRDPPRRTPGPRRDPRRDPQAQDESVCPEADASPEVAYGSIANVPWKALKVAAGLYSGDGWMEILDLYIDEFQETHGPNAKCRLIAEFALAREVEYDFTNVRVTESRKVFKLMTLDNPYIVVDGRPHTYGISLWNSYVHTMLKETDQSTVAADKIIKSGKLGASLEIINSVGLLFMRHAPLAKFLQCKILRHRGPLDFCTLHGLWGQFKEKFSPDLDRFVSKVVMRNGRVQKVNTDLNGYTCADVLGALSEWYYNKKRFAFLHAADAGTWKLDEGQILSMLSQSPFHKGQNLMLPHIVSSLKQMGKISNWQGHLSLRKKGSFTAKMMQHWFPRIDEALVLQEVRAELVKIKGETTSAKMKAACDRLAELEVDNLRAILCKVCGAGRNFVTTDVSNWRGDAIPKIVKSAQAYLDLHDDIRVRPSKKCRRR